MNEAADRLESGEPPEAITKSLITFTSNAMQPCATTQLTAIAFEGTTPGVWVGYIAELRGATTQAGSLAEVLTELENAAADILRIQGFQEAGISLTHNIVESARTQAAMDFADKLHKE
jgi:hypothetical protein